MAIPFGRYQLLKKLAAGGMGQVFLAKTGAQGFEKLVVVKRILPHLVEDEEFFTMFLDEARICARLNHPNIAQIFELGEERGAHFIVMEYVAGDDVRRMTKKAKAEGVELPLGVILRVIADAAAGLDHAHKARDTKGNPLGLVHRDVSPQNVLVGFDGGVKLIDFGVAKAAGRAQHTATGILKGKFPYMSPEQAEGEEIDPRSDIFALAIVLWELLTDRRLFKGENDVMTQRLVKACQVPPPSAMNPGIPHELDAIVLKALQKNRDDRYADCLSFRMALEEFALAAKLPTSSAHVAAFMQPLYGDRIAAETDPAQLDELTSENDIDPLAAAGGSRPGTPMTSPPGARLDGGGRTEAVAPTAMRGGRKTGLWLGLGLAGVGAIAVVGWATLQKRQQADDAALAKPPVVDAQPVAPPKPPDPKPVEPVQPTPPETLAFKLESEPKGASVEYLGRTLGTTPLDFELKPAELPATVKVLRDGFEPSQATLTAEGQRTVSLTLKKRGRQPKAQPQFNIKTGR